VTLTNYSASYNLTFAQPAIDGSFAVAFMEKIYAKLLGTYQSLNQGGDPREALDFLTGAPTNVWYLDEFCEFGDEDEELFTIITDASANAFPLVAVIFNEDIEYYGLQGGIAYTVLGATKVYSTVGCYYYDGNEDEACLYDILVQVRSSTGTQQYTGPWNP
jgi:hypothetical protein